jgi:hypothetical protein
MQTRTEEEMNYDLATINSNAHNFLARAQDDLHTAIEAYGQASDEFADAEQRLREAREAAIRRLREEKMPVTLILDVSKGMTASLKTESLKAEARVKKAQHTIRAIEHRINSVKFIGRRTNENAERGNLG